jgi:xanthine/uracil permease
MERSGVVFPFHHGKRELKVNETNNPTEREAKDALASIETMESAGYRRAVPERWFGAGVAFLVACLFALYAMEDPYPYIVFPIIGLGVLIVAAREKAGAYGRDFPGTKANRWAFVLFVAAMIVVFFGTIFIRRAYDLYWVPIIVGLLVGLVVFWLSESERRSYLAKAGGGQAK